MTTKRMKVNAFNIPVRASTNYCIPDSEDSSDSSDEDDVSLNSKTDIGALYFDENVCPKDCDRSLYDLTIKLRSRRQSLETSNRFCQTEIENIKKTLTTLGRKLTEHEKQLGVYNEELIASMVMLQFPFKSYTKPNEFYRKRSKT